MKIAVAILLCAFVAVYAEEQQQAEIAANDGASAQAPVPAAVIQTDTINRISNANAKVNEQKAKSLAETLKTKEQLTREAAAERQNRIDQRNELLRENQLQYNENLLALKAEFDSHRVQKNAHQAALREERRNLSKLRRQLRKERRQYRKQQRFLRHRGTYVADAAEKLGPAALAVAEPTGRAAAAESETKKQ